MWVCVSPVAHSPTPTHTHTCPLSDKTSTAAAPNVFAHQRRLTALPHWMTQTIYSDAASESEGEFRLRLKKEKKKSDTTWKHWGRAGEGRWGRRSWTWAAETSRYMRLSVNITASLLVGQSLTGLMNTAGRTRTTLCQTTEGNSISPASAGRGRCATHRQS